VGGPNVIDLELALSPGVFQQIVDLGSGTWPPCADRSGPRLLFPIAYAF
jgi:hypothetical protein